MTIKEILRSVLIYFFVVSSAILLFSLFVAISEKSLDALYFSGGSLLVSPTSFFLSRLLE